MRRNGEAGVPRACPAPRARFGWSMRFRFWPPAALAVGLAAWAAAAPVPAVPRETFLTSPAPGVAVLAAAYPASRDGGELVSLHQLMSRSDTVDRAFVRRSLDHGLTWTAEGEVPMVERRPEGTLRRALRGLTCDPRTGRLVRLRIEGLFRTEDPLEGMRVWSVWYEVSRDAGRTWDVDEPVVHAGAGFSREHPLPGVTVGRNACMIGDLASVPLWLEDGTVLVPVMITPAGPDGSYHNPGGGYTYSDVAVLRGRWTPDGRRLAWEMSRLIRADPARTTRGLDEPTLARLEGGRLLIVMRGSNDRRPELPGRRWVAQSSDDGRTWSEPAPWTYEDGGDFFSPSSCSQLVEHSSGRLLWLGNLTSGNPAGNRPRYPLVMGEVDRRSGRLLRGSVRVIDDRGPGDSERLMLSNFVAREDRASGTVLLHLTRLFARSVGEPPDWTADALVYPISFP